MDDNESSPQKQQEDQQGPSKRLKTNDDNVTAAVASKDHLGNMKSANFPIDDDGRPLHLQWKKGDIASRIILVGSCDRATLFATQGLDPSTIQKYTSTRGFLAYTGYPKKKQQKMIEEQSEYNKISIVAVGMGYPMMDFVIRELRSAIIIDEDTPMIIVRVGTCGTPCENVKPGTFVQCYPGSYYCYRNIDSFNNNTGSTSSLGGLDLRLPPYKISTNMVQSNKELSTAIYNACINDECIIQE